MRQLWAMLVRDLRIDTSYRLAFLLQFAGVLFSVLIFYFLSDLIGGEVSAQIDGGDYFSYVLIGIAFSGYLGVGLNSFASALRNAQTTGTLEALMMTPTRPATVVIGSAAYSYLFTTLRVLVYLALGALLGVKLSFANWPAAGVGLILAIIAFASIGIMAAGVILVLKRGDPITWLVANLATLLGGVYYPITILPDWLQPIARLLPIPYALNVMRGALLRGATWGNLAPDLLILLGFCVVLFPLAMLVFTLALRKARQDGSLTHY